MSSLDERLDAWTGKIIVILLSVIISVCGFFGGSAYNMIVKNTSTLNSLPEAFSKMRVEITDLQVIIKTMQRKDSEILFVNYEEGFVIMQMPVIHGGKTVKFKITKYP